jgi:Bacterial PH domain
MAHDHADTPPAIHIPLAPMRQRRAKLLNAVISHGPAAALLLQHGLSRLSGRPFPVGVELAVALLASVAGAWQALVLLREVRESRHHELAARAVRLGDGPEVSSEAAPAEALGAARSDDHESLVHGPSMALALVYVAEVALHVHETGHIVRPYVLGAISFAVLGLGGMRAIARRRRGAHGLTIDSQGVTLRRPRRGTQHFAWPAVSSIERSSRAVRVVHQNGSELVIDAAEHDHGLDVVRRTRLALDRFAPMQLVPGLVADAAAPA